MYECKETGNGKNTQNAGCSMADAKQCYQFNISAADASVCRHGNGKQQCTTAEETKECHDDYQHRRKERFLPDRKRDGKKTPWKESKQGGIADLMVSVIIEGKKKECQKGQQTVKKHPVTHVCCTSHHTDCPESVWRHLS